MNITNALINLRDDLKTWATNNLNKKLDKTTFEHNIQTISTVFTPDTVGWYRVASVPVYSDAPIAYNPSCDIRFFNVFNNRQPGISEVSLVCNSGGFFFKNEFTHNGGLFNKIRVCTNGETLYLDLYYTMDLGNGMRVTINNSHDAFGRTWSFMETPYIVDEAPSGDTIQVTYSFNAMSHSLLSNQSNLTHIKRLTQAEYDALSTKDENTIYLTT